MSATTHGAGCGVVLGIVIVILLQQVGYTDLSDLVPSLEVLFLGAIIGGVIGALLGWVLGVSYLARHATPPETTAK